MTSGEALNRERGKKLNREISPQVRKKPESWKRWWVQMGSITPPRQGPDQQIFFLIKDYLENVII